MKLSVKASLIALVLAILISTSVYTVFQTEKAIILRLGKLVKDPKTKTPKVYGPGLNFKLPLIDDVQKFDTRINMLDVQSSRITTDEQKDLLVDFYVQWKIDDFDLFYLRNNGNKLKAKSLLEQKVVSILKAEFGQRKIQDVVSGERSELMEAIRTVANDRAKKDLGISVIDVRIKRIDFPDEVVESSIYPRMRAERERAASEIRSEGRSLAIVIRADAEKKRRVLLATADKDAKLLRGNGDAQATKIYAEAYGKSPEFFEFLRSLDAYKNTFNSKSDMLVIKPDGEFFKYFKISDRSK